MKIVRCSNGHFVDIDKYDACPLCNASVKGTKSTGAPNNPPPVVSLGANKSTVGVYDLNTQDKASVPEPSTPIVNDPNIEISNRTTPSQGGMLDEEPVQKEPVSNGLAEELSKLKVDNGGKTVGFFGAAPMHSEVPQKQEGIPVSAPVVTAEPIVAWLVCIGGPHLGEPFCVFAGRNSIGRNNTNTIVISRDNTVSREKHAWIMYEPRRREYYVQPGDASGLVYVDGENVMISVQVKRNSIIELGETKLMLIPVCDENFSWEDYLK